ncbi:hypothetical protein MD484_g3626, partial [Candolleomyces efflorescens]
MQHYPDAPAATHHNKPLNLVDVGATVGVLDATQKARVLRNPNSTLHFSAFDPLTASGQDVNLEFRKLNIQQEEKYPPKRIVLEVSPNGQSSWRFVPRARKEEGAKDEGMWPRVVDLCGQLAYCSQDQWDIYKLDSFYECVVQPIPALSTIRPKDANAQPQGRRAPTPAGKRVFEGDNTVGDMPKKRVHVDVTMESLRDTSEDDHGDDEDEDEEYLVAGMITEEQQYRNPRSPVAPRRVRLKTPSKTRKAHVAPRPMRKKPVSQAGPSHPPVYHQARQSHSMPPESSNKRKEGYESRFEAVKEEDEDEDYSPRKRANIARSTPERRAPSVPTGVAQRELRARRREREEQKRKRWEEEQKARIRQREQQLMQDIMNGIPPLQQFQPYPPSGFCHPEIDRDSSMRGFSDFEDGGTKPGPSSAAFSSAEEASRAAQLEESRRKLAQLEADRPIWEKAAHERRAREEAEEAARWAKAEAKKRQEEERIRQERERFRQEQQEAEAQIRREEARKEAAKAERARERQAKKERWSSGRWTTARAIERFREVSKTFSDTQFSKDNPLAIDDVPWPTLRRPDELSLPEDVDWDSVEYFFEELKNHMKTQDYISLVEKNSRAFHPDRWRSRGLFKAIVDPEERNWMEIGTCVFTLSKYKMLSRVNLAATTVSQALTPIWQKVRVMKQA